MLIMNSLIDHNGRCSVIESWELDTPPEGFYKISEDLDTTIYYDYEGFVNPVLDESETTIIAFVPNQEAYNNSVSASIEIYRSRKEAEISRSCNSAILAGMDVETTQGIEHFSLQETDQINLTTALAAVQQGVSMYPYHADGQLCRLFTAEEIVKISEASIIHKLYHTTLCNHLLTWVRREESIEEVKSIRYSADILPEDLATNMASILAAYGG